MSLNLKFACNQICLNSQRFSLFNEIASRGLRFKYSPNPNNIFRFENKFHTICANDNYSENSKNTVSSYIFIYYISQFKRRDHALCFLSPTIYKLI